MSKEDKRNIIVAAVLAIAAVFVLYWMRSGQKVIYTQNPDLPMTPDTTGAANPTLIGLDAGGVPPYMSYNVPAYDPGALGDINMPAYIGGSVFGGNPNITANDNSSGKGCCPGCAGDDVGILNNIPSFSSLMGLGSSFANGDGIVWPPASPSGGGFPFAEAVG